MYEITETSGEARLAAVGLLYDFLPFFKERFERFEFPDYTYGKKVLGAYNDSQELVAAAIVAPVKELRGCLGLFEFALFAPAIEGSAVFIFREMLRFLRDNYKEVGGVVTFTGKDPRIHSMASLAFPNARSLNLEVSTRVKAPANVFYQMSDITS